jgi:hypothetical protein
MLCCELARQRRVSVPSVVSPSSSAESGRKVRSQLLEPF